ncbi:efflux RND transporter periplasmic adaptor subunit [Candidatus Giovannonibacteria bacterium]|nr:efflux RND transporter periplasmic adaptor subunit [Candidatus Giovannonibacteria bacterium]
MTKIVNAIRNHLFWSLLIIFLIGGAAYFAFFRKEKVEIRTVLAERGDLVQEISVTGKVQPSESVDLAFKKSGKVSGIFTAVGSLVFAGARLAQLENRDLVAALDGAKANLLVEMAKLEELEKGTRPEEIQVEEVKVQNARVALEDSKKALRNSIMSSYTNSDDAVRHKVDQFFTNPRSASPSVNFSSSNPQLEIDLETGRLNIEILLVNWQEKLKTLNDDNAFELSKISADNLNSVKNFLDKASAFANSLTATPSLTQTTIDSYRTDVATARTNVNSAISGLATSEEDVRTSESSLALATQQLVLKKAGTIPEEIAGAKARVASYRASVESAEAALNDSYLYAPLSGVVTKKNAKVGEIVAANASVLSVISDSEFEIEANIPEADIAKIELFDSAKVTLDAYGSDIEFEAKVSKIDPAETVLEGVSTYKVTLQFSKKDERVKSGMTANIDISTDRRENVIKIPQRAVIARDGKKFVKILEGEKNDIREIEVRTGLAANGEIEILSGVKEGDKIVTAGI